MRKHYGEIFYRFVNDDDIVPLVPPGYRHVGRFYQFDGSGRLKARIESVGVGLEEEGPPTMSEAEFDRLRATLLQQRAALRSREDRVARGYRLARILYWRGSFQASVTTTWTPTSSRSQRWRRLSAFVAPSDPELATAFRERWTLPRRAMAVAVFQEAIERGSCGGRSIRRPPSTCSMPPCITACRWEPETCPRTISRGCSSTG